MAYEQTPRVRQSAASARRQPQHTLQEPQEWQQEEPQDEAFDTALHLASHAQRLKSMEGHFAQIESNLRHIRFQASEDRRRQHVLMGILAGGFILSILITAFARPSAAPSARVANAPPPRAMQAQSPSSMAQGLAMAGAQLQDNTAAAPYAQHAQNALPPVQSHSQPQGQQQIINALQAPAPVQPVMQPPSYARAPSVQAPVYAPPQQYAPQPAPQQPPVQALGSRYDQQLLPASVLTPPQQQFQQQPQRPRSAFEEKVRARLAARGENMPPEWSAYFERDARGDRKGRLLVAGKFLKGDGVGRDQAFAIEVIRAAADEGEKEAMMWLAYANQGGNLGRTDLASAVRWFEAAARAGVAQANTELGRIFERGVDGVPDVDTAMAWYLRGKQAGDAKANEALARLQSRPAAQQASAISPQAGFADPAAQDIQRMVQNGGAQSSDDVFTPASPEPAYAARTVAASVPVPSTQVGMDPQDAAADVRAVQRMLKALGYRIENVDGEFGPETATAIRTYQRDRALYPDGEPTPQLIEALSRDMRFGD